MSGKISDQDLNELLFFIQNLLEKAPNESECSKEENDVYADMANLKNSIETFLIF